MEPNRKSLFLLFCSSLVILGNVLGVGTLALPIVSGLCGYFLALLGIIVIWFIMLMSAFVIIYKIDSSKKNFDMPSFYANEIGGIFKFISILCNMIILYGVLVALLSGVSTMISSLFEYLSNYQYLVTVIYFAMCVSIILFGLKELRRSMLLLIIMIWICFFIMLLSSVQKFNYSNFNNFYIFYLPLCLPIAISSAHFHNIIPTVSKMLDYDKIATYKVTVIGIVIGLIINLIWMTVVVFTVPIISDNNNNIVYSYLHGIASNVPMTAILGSKIFTVFSLLFALLTTTTSFLTTGAGLYGYMSDILYNNFKNDSIWFVGSVSFIPPLLITFVYPDLFISALSIVGGIGESILFGILPAVVLLKIIRLKRLQNNISIKNYNILFFIGCFMFIISFFVLIYITLKQFNLIPDPNFYKDIIM